MNSIIFDYDGVLVDSKEAVRIAYSLVGVEMPDDAWGKPWQEWLPQVAVGRAVSAEQLHKLKNNVLLGCIHMMRRLPLYDWAIKLKTPIITGASELAVRSMDPLKLLNVVRFEQSLEAKIAFLNGPCCERDYDRDGNCDIHPRGCGRIYVDDDPRVIQEVTKKTTWTALTPDQALTRLYSLPVPTLG